MKKFTLLVFCVSFGFTYPQFNERFLTQQQIDDKIEEAKSASVEHPKKTIVLLEDIYTEAKKTGYKKAMLESLVFRMMLYYDTGNPKKIIKFSEEAEKIAGELNDIESLCHIHRLKGQAYDQLAFFDKSRKELQKSSALSEKISSDNSRYYSQSLIYQGIASLTAHTTNNSVDSVMYYQKKAIESTIKIDDSKDFINKKYNRLAFNYINMAMTNAALKNFGESEYYLTKALDICKNKEYLISKRTEILIFNEFAWLYYTQKKYDKSIEYGEQAEIMEKQTGLPYIRRDIYEVLFKSYVEAGNKTNASKYTKLFTSLNDSIVNAEKIAVDTPVGHIMKEEKEAHKNNIFKVFMIAGGIIILTIVSGWFLWKNKQSILHKRYKVAIENLKNTAQKKSASVTEKSIVITDETLNDLLQKLKKFEESQKFLRKDMNLTYLANSLNTNTRYLSEVINQHKGKNFYNYLNGLRIQYITDLLYKEPKYREYKVSYLAEVCGFTSREVFSVIFKKETGMTPSHFINNLRKKESEI